MAREEKNKKGSIFKKMAPYMGNKKICIPIAMVLSGLSAILSLLPFYFIWKISNELFAGNNISIENVKHYVLMAFLATIAGIFVNFLG